MSPLENIRRQVIYNLMIVTGMPWAWVEDGKGFGHDTQELVWDN